jgi:hypothetical protein
MNIARVLLFAILSTFVPMLPAESHSWYPKECCSNYDCVPADAIVSDEQGGKIVVVGQTRISIPDGFTTRSSPDGRIHVCFRTVAGEQYGGPNFLPLCLFLPAQS